MKILLFGCNGQLGWELQRSLAPLGELIALSSHPQQGALCGDLLRADAVAKTISQVAPDVVVNAAAYTQVDRAESDRETARQVNAYAPEVMACAAQQCGALFVHYSTDYVFDGTGDVGWGELDPPAPLNVYGATKLAGEKAVAANCARHLILRTSWLHSVRGTNFPRSILMRAASMHEMSVVHDQHGAPTGTDLLADISAHVVRATLADDRLAGLYHVCAAGETCWYDYARFVIDHAVRTGVPLKLSADNVRAVTSADFPTAAKRPLNSRLDTSKFKSAFGLVLPPWQHGVTRMLCESLNREGAFAS